MTVMLFLFGTAALVYAAVGHWWSAAFMLGCWVLTFAARNLEERRP